MACSVISRMSQRRHPMVIRFDDGRNGQISLVRWGIWSCSSYRFNSVCNTNLAKWYAHTRSCTTPTGPLDRVLSLGIEVYFSYDFGETLLGPPPHPVD